MEQRLYYVPIHPCFWLAIAIVSALVSSVATWLLLGWPRPGRDRWMMVALLVVAAAPLWVPRSDYAYRVPAALVAVAMLVKLYDLHVSDGMRPPLRQFLPYLFNVFLLVYRKRDEKEGKPDREKDLRALALAMAKAALALPLCILAFWYSWRGVPLLIEHATKVIAVFLFIEPGCALVAALWRLSGRTTREFMRAPLLASTPADFWRRYNRPVQQFFHDDLFVPWGGRRAPLRLTFVTFVVSALIHEYVFGIILGRVLGFQTAFFLLQGVAATATLRLRPRCAWQWIARAATLAFNIVTSVLFFANLNQVLPFYSRPLPWPLAGW